MSKLYPYLRCFCARISKYLFNQLTRDKLRFKWNYSEEYGLVNFLSYTAKCYLNNLLPPNYKINLAITAIAKNEASYIREWIEFHRLVGVEKFFIYDNESTDNLKEILQPYIDSEIVEYICFPGKCRQFAAYRNSIRRNANKVKYMAFIDCDEFITPIKHNTIPEFIEYLEKKINHKIDALGINWIMHGYNGHYEKQEGLVCENYSKCDLNTGANQHIKSIVRLRSVISNNHPHFCIHKLFSKIVNANGEEMYGPFTEPHLDEIVIHHYYTKSYTETKNKIQKGLADQTNKRQISAFMPPAKEQPKKLEFVPDFLSVDEDHSMDRFIPLLKEKLGIN